MVTLGITVAENELFTVAEKQAQDLAQKTLTTVSDRCQVDLSWKNDNIKFFNNKAYALQRLRSQEKKMDRDTAYAQRYAESIESYIEEGYPRKLFSEEAAASNDKT